MLVGRTGALIAFIKSSISDQGSAEILAENADFKMQIDLLFQGIIKMDERKRAVEQKLTILKPIVESYGRY